MYQTDPPRSPKDYLPTMYDLPSEDPEEPGLPDQFHIFQPRLLEETFRPPNYPQEQILVASDLNLYYDPRHTLWYKRPDWYAVLGVPRLYEERDLRLSYVVWQEGVNPFIVVELLSPGTEKEDLGQTLRDIDQPPTKWEVYEQILRIPYYAIFDRYTYDFKVFKLNGGRYAEVALSESRTWIPEIDLGLGVWQGSYQNIEQQWLRWYDKSGNWILTPTERLAAQLRALGVEPDLG
ncbi:Uma2 family endonuclease [Calothrix sp. FACHB-1219]|uniref:Uma2 family endonuclease n=1 Tax=unclassified Calothrix TaxID=2619626 RepID=UPI00168A3800|nr:MULTISPECIES: Uma2 family endonuclease [unclassified Calothrix]MBD2203149.1 Uma2 family endonuclease [Calothrix sp. FACHB-168]MBD2218750.1 Uma2 family endonuclease [Calothrix sp. FACHB-1219]